MAARLNHFRLRVPFTPRPPGAVFPTPISGLHAWPPSSIRGVGLPCCVSPSLCLGGSGILTGCPSPTPLGLGLGPTNPTRINLPSETSDLRGSCFSHDLRYSCRHSHFCPLHQFSQSGFSADRTLPYRPSQSERLAASVLGLSPVTFSAQDHLTSELLRTL